MSGSLSAGFSPRYANSLEEFAVIEDAVRESQLDSSATIKPHLTSLEEPEGAPARAMQE